MKSLRPPSLRVRVATAFAAFGALVSIALSVLVHVAEHDISQRLVDQTLAAEMEDFLQRRLRNPASLAPATATLRGYVAAQGSADLPPAIAHLAPGRHELELDGVPWRALVREHDGVRVHMLFNMARQHDRERRFAVTLAGAAVLVTLLSAGAGLWLARRVLRPVTELARIVRRADPDRPPRFPGATDPDREDEVAELTRAFDHFVERLYGFVDRERAFAADASHELRTPLAIVAGAAEILAGEPSLTAAQFARVDRIRRAAAEMSETIAALLLMAREDEQPPARPTCVDRIVANLVARSGAAASAHRIELALHVEARPRVDVQEPLLGMVVGNLLRNAIAHSAGRAVAVHVTASSVVIADTGVGIAAADLERVFDRHYKGPASEGAGIGLALVRRICERVRWGLEIRSSVGSGTTAILRFTPAGPAGAGS